MPFIDLRAAPIDNICQICYGEVKEEEQEANKFVA
jgi:hypothetical protein